MEAADVDISSLAVNISSLATHSSARADACDRIAWVVCESPIQRHCHVAVVYGTLEHAVLAKALQPVWLITLPTAMSFLQPRVLIKSLLFSIPHAQPEDFGAS